MNIIIVCLLPLLIPVLAQEDSICTPIDESGNTVDLEDDSTFFNFLFVQYREVFRDLLGRRCVYSPSCSHYGQEIIERGGLCLES